MNLVLAGAVDDSLRNRAIELTRPVQAVRLSSGSWRLEGAQEGPKERQAIASLCESARIDHAYVDAGTRFADMKLLAMDMDSTLINIECIDEIADYMGKKSEVAAITEAAMRGEIEDFSESLKRRVALLKGADVDVLNRVFQERLKLNTGARTLISAAQAAGISTLLISGGFTYFTDRLSNLLDLSFAYANNLKIVNGRLTGELTGPIMDAQGKADIVKALQASLSCGPTETIAVGDGANDILMFNAVCHSVAYHGKPLLRNASRYQIDYGTLQCVVDFFQ